MIYCDASLVVALLVPEKISGAANEWMSAQSPDRLVASPLTATEIGSALAMKRRLGHIDAAGHAATIRAAARLIASFASVDVDRRHFDAAGDRFVTAPPAGLRSGDALHFAIVVDHNFVLATLDRPLAAAARQSGVTVEGIVPA